MVSGAWLEANLGDPELRVYDCTTHLRLEEGTGQPYRVESGWADWAAGHIPGSVHLDPQADLSDDDAPTRFMRLSPEATAQAFARLGVGPDSRVILYARNSPQWATRVWWLLRWIGFDNAAVLDGGMESWTADGRPITTTVTAYPEAHLVARPRLELFVGKDEMLAAIGDGETCSLNALSPDMYAGKDPRYGRPGRIPGSTNVPATSLIDPASKTFRDPQTVRTLFEGAGATPGKRILNYCGGGIAATLDAFLLHQLGYSNIAVYDASMSEWAKDPALPMEAGG